MNYQKVNIYSGWAIWLIATIVYLLTLEPTAGFWDTGEFIASAYKLEVGHPPGAPFFMLIARAFSIFAPEGQAAASINFMSALCSSFTILFLYWSITHFAKGIADKSGELTKSKLIAILGSGAVGALAYTFSDSFWFSAVEGEVYAMSSLFTAIVFWAILKWESVAHRDGEIRWIIFIAYMMGLSIGVHLLNLLAIPAIAFVYYFKRYPVTWKGIVATGVIAVGALGLVQVGVIQGLVNLAGRFELLFVNSFGMPFNSGVIVYALLIVGLMAFLIYFTQKKDMPALNTLVLSVLMLVIGYSTFAVIVIRSSANPPMDENNPENLFSLLSYLNREQYGDRPLLYGQYFNTPVSKEDPYKDGPATYIKSYSVKKEGRRGEKLVKSFVWKHEAEQYAKEKGKGHSVVDEYIDSGLKKNSVPNYEDALCGVFPRMYSSNQRHINEYKQWSDYKGWTSGSRDKVKRMEGFVSQLERSQNKYYQFYQMSGREVYRDSLINTMKSIERMNLKMLPTFSENMRYFFNYQIGWMYGRYFMWNFAGKQNDIQGHGSFDKGNWMTGIDSIDEQRLGNRSELPLSEIENKGFNKFFLIPLILGLMGLVFQLLRAPKDFSVVTLLFVLTGLAIVVYLNQYPYQPRERDYAYVGSFYAFAIWIGLSVYSLYYASVNMKWKDLGTVAAMTVGAGIVIYGMESIMDSTHSFSYSLIYMGLIASLLYGLAVALGRGGVSSTVKASLFTVLCLTGPLLMAIDGWDDHSRAGRSTAVDFGKNYLDSLAPNAILFTNGDNDTFPLWYLQEVEGYRTDVRIVNMSLLNTDWYAEQMKRQAYDSPPVPITIPEHKYRQGTRDVVLLSHEKNVQDAYIDLDRAMRIALDDSKKQEAGDGKKYAFLPSNKFSLPVDSAKIVEMGIVRPEQADQIVDRVEWQIHDGARTKSFVTKNSFVALEILRSNNWERPVYFAVTTGPEVYLGLQEYFRLEGLAYRLVPIKYGLSTDPNLSGEVDTDIMYENMMNQFQWGGMDNKDGIYLDENNRRMVMNFRLQFGNLAEKLIEENDYKRAEEVLDRAMVVMPEENVALDRLVLPIIDAYFAIQANEKAKDLSQRLFDIQEDELNYWISLDNERKDVKFEDAQLYLSLARRLHNQMQKYMPTDEATTEMGERMDNIMTRMEEAAEAMN